MHHLLNFTYAKSLLNIHYVQGITVIAKGYITQFPLFPGAQRTQICDTITLTL